VTPDGKLKLIDFEAMYLPTLKGLNALLLGGVHFQHPARNAHHFDRFLDHFSMLVISLSLRALTMDPKLYDRFHIDESIILKREDFLVPRRSLLIKKLLASPDAFTRSWAHLLVKACSSRSMEIPGLKRVLKSSLKATTEVTQGGVFGLFS
jgi:hypothetical protein